MKPNVVCNLILQTRSGVQVCEYWLERDSIIPTYNRQVVQVTCGEVAVWVYNCMYIISNSLSQGSSKLAMSL